MGKKTVKTIDMSEKETKEKKQAKTKEAKEKKAVEKTEAEKKEEGKEKKAAKKQKSGRSKRYKALKAKVEDKLYEPGEAVETLLGLTRPKLDETVELHIITKPEKLVGSVNLPHGTGKKQNIAIADDKILGEIEKGKIDFDILIATPQFMPKIARLARVLGPKGLMPNPKTGTITDKPEELKKKLEQGEVKFKTENKAPLLHLIIGKTSFGKEKIKENLDAVVKAVSVRNIKKATLTSTQAPGIKLDPSFWKAE